VRDCAESLNEVQNEKKKSLLRSTGSLKTTKLKLFLAKRLGINWSLMAFLCLLFPLGLATVLRSWFIINGKRKKRFSLVIARL
jgi:hypothetical protein